MLNKDFTALLKRADKEGYWNRVNDLVTLGYAIQWPGDVRESDQEPDNAALLRAVKAELDWRSCEGVTLTPAQRSLIGCD